MPKSKVQNSNILQTLSLAAKSFKQQFVHQFTIFQVSYTKPIATTISFHPIESSKEKKENKRTGLGQVLMTRGMDKYIMHRMSLALAISLFVHRSAFLLSFPFPLLPIRGG